MKYFSVPGVTNAFLLSHAFQTHSKILFLKSNFICICNADAPGSAFVKRQTKASFEKIGCNSKMHLNA
jgi:hypothetical protein